MSFWKDVIESLGSIFTSDSSSSSSSSSSLSTGKSSSNQTAAAMDSVATGNERVAYKLKGYLDLANGEIAKAVSAEEWGLPNDAIPHYQSAERILAEGFSTPVPSYITSSELEKVKSFRNKISQRQGQVLDRLKILGRRSGGASTVKVWTAFADVLLQSGWFLLTQLGSIFILPLPATLWTNNATTRVQAHATTSLKPSSPRVGNPVTQRQNNNAGTSKPLKENDGYDAKLVEMINAVIVDRSPSVKWEDIAGLDKAKQALLEMVILPTKRKDLFTGLRRPARGLLLFGPPGTGKTMLAKAVASESEATFFSVSASSLTSKWVGEGEKLVRTLFDVAISRQPSVIFIDEIDSIMSTRTSNENEASRRLKSEFLIQFDGVTTTSGDLVIVIGATNKPQELDDAVLRRLVKRIYIPLPDANVRRQLLKNKLKGQKFSLPDRDLEILVVKTEGYSGSDLQALCGEAAMMPIRELGANILTINANQVRGLRYGDFEKAMSVVRPSVQKSKWKELEQWNREFGAN